MGSVFLGIMQVSLYNTQGINEMLAKNENLMTMNLAHIRTILTHAFIGTRD